MTQEKAIEITHRIGEWVRRAPWERVKYLVVGELLRIESAERDRCAKMLEDRASLLSANGRPVFTASMAAGELAQQAKRIRDGGHRSDKLGEAKDDD